MSSSKNPAKMKRSKNPNMEIATVEFIAPAVTSTNPVIQKTKNNSVNKPNPIPIPAESSFNQPFVKFKPSVPNGRLSIHLSTTYTAKRNDVIMNKYCINMNGDPNSSDLGSNSFKYLWKNPKGAVKTQTIKK